MRAFKCHGRFRHLAPLVAVILASKLAPALNAQASASDSVKACSVPATGNLYRVGLGDTPASCRTGHTSVSLGFSVPLSRSLAVSGALLELQNTQAGIGHALKLNASTGWSTLHTENSGAGVTGWFANSGTGSAVEGRAQSIYPAGVFRNTGTGGAVYGESQGINATGAFLNTGTGSGVFARSAGASSAIHGENAGGLAAQFQSRHAVSSALWAQSIGSDHTAGFNNDGLGGAIYGKSVGSAATGTFLNEGSGVALFAKSDGPIHSAFAARSQGQFHTGGFVNTGPGGALYGESAQASATGTFRNTGGGIALSAESSGEAARLVGNVNVQGSLFVNGNQIIAGSKSAVVLTDGGPRLMYSEEATEVWFTDYGTAKLNAGETWVPLDPGYSQVINSQAVYHVFVQPYSAAELYVSERTPQGFRVKLGRGDPQAEFSFRIVAKRLRFENERLERISKIDVMLRSTVQH